MVHYFAYGSNMDKKRMKSRCPDSKIVSSGILKGYKLVFNKIASAGGGQGYANIVIDNNSMVEGIVWEFSSSDMAGLDECEGGYGRKDINIKCGKKTISCQIYIADPNKTKEGLKPTKQYLEYLFAGKKYLSKEYFKFLEGIETLD
jgi:gamma-glutamylcyclotransferase (GGCT)/AIG2-like uncharacterized protein YtfP